MAGKVNFTPEEWARVVTSPMVAGMAITAADPSGLWGLLKEAMAGGWSLLDAKQNAAANPLATRPWWTPRLPRTQPGSRHGCATSPRRPRKRATRAVFWALAALRSAMRNGQPWRRSRQLSAAPPGRPELGRCGSAAPTSEPVG